MYLILTIVFVRGFVLTGDVTIAKEAIQELVSGSAGQIAATLTAFGVLLNSTSSTTDVAGVYQAFVFILISLVIIWALRQTHADQAVKLKDSLYSSTYPLVQFLLVMLVVGLQSVPLLVAIFLYRATIASGVVVAGIEMVLWGFLSFLLALWSLYMVTASIFALYIVTLPDMTPLKALRSAKGLVELRRWTVMRKLLFLPLVIFGIIAVIMLPVILIIAPVAEVLFIIISAVSVAVVHSYIYSLYRELL